MEEQAGGKRNAWMTHVKKTMKANKGKPLSAVLKMAKKTYKKTRRGGGLSPMPLSGGRRRGGQEEEEMKPEEMMQPMQTPPAGARKTKSRSRKH